MASINYIGLLNEYSQKKKIDFPVYTCKQEGQPHLLTIICTLNIENRAYTESSHNMKTAKQLCAKKAVADLEVEKFLEETVEKEKYSITCLGTDLEKLWKNTTAEETEFVLLKSFEGQREYKTIKMETAEKNTLKIMFLSEKATLPSRVGLAAGYDLSSAETTTIPPQSRKLIKTDLAIKVPHGTYGRIAARSGLSLNYKIDIAGGVIDEDYTGNVGVILCNNSLNFFTVAHGMRIAQLILEKITTPEITIVKTLDETVRGGNGFGSTGL